MPDRAPELQLRRRAMQQRVHARRELQLFMRRLGILLAALVLLVFAGSAGFALAEHVSIAYGFVWTLDTVTTLGAIPDPRDTAGHIVVVGLELFGIGTLFYGLATVAEFFVSGQLSGLLEDRRTQRMIDSYTDHFIICGFGRVGRQVARDFRRAATSHIVIDNNPENREAARVVDVPYLEGEAADEELLQRAGIARARGVVACVDSDAENIFITLTARELRSDIQIIARASAEDSERKLLRAGADRVVSPYKTSGSEMARVALHPQVGVALEGTDYRMEEIEVRPDCRGAGKTIAAVRGSSVIVAVRRLGGALEPQPSAEAVLNPGDRLLALGSPDALELLEGLFQPASATT